MKCLKFLHKIAGVFLLIPLILSFLIMFALVLGLEGRKKKKVKE